MNDLILAEGDIGIDAEGWAHGPLRRRADGLGLYANTPNQGYSMSWDFHGNSLGSHNNYPDLVGKGRMEPKEPAPKFAHPAYPDLDMVQIHFTRHLAIEHGAALIGLMHWVEGLAMGSKIPRSDLPPGLDAARDVSHLLLLAAKDRT